MSISNELYPTLTVDDFNNKIKSINAYIQLIHKIPSVNIGFRTPFISKLENEYNLFRNVINSILNQALPQIYGITEDGYYPDGYNLTKNSVYEYFITEKIHSNLSDYTSLPDSPVTEQQITAFKNTQCPDKFLFNINISSNNYATTKDMEKQSIITLSGSRYIKDYRDNSKQLTLDWIQPVISSSQSKYELKIPYILSSAIESHNIPKELSIAIGPQKPMFERRS